MNKNEQKNDFDNNFHIDVFHVLIFCKPGIPKLQAWNTKPSYQAAVREDLKNTIFSVFVRFILLFFG